jgi:hypothetical protein
MRRLTAISKTEIFFIEQRLCSGYVLGVLSLTDTSTYQAHRSCVANELSGILASTPRSLKQCDVPGWGNAVSVYDHKPDPFLERVIFDDEDEPAGGAHCAGFELEIWRCDAFADHLIEWLPEYALPEEELDIHHGNIFVRLREAAYRVYTSEKYEKRGEVGEIALHAICRQFFDTVPISPRVFYKSSSNDVVKSFDMVHARYPGDEKLELWLGEAKLYKDAHAGVAAAIKSVREHLDADFLRKEKFLLGRQLSPKIPMRDRIVQLFKSQSSLDHLLAAAVFPICILANSGAVAASKKIDQEYLDKLSPELTTLTELVKRSGLTDRVRVLLLYVPLGDKDALLAKFHARLKALQ